MNLDGFILTHTYEEVDIPDEEQADKFLPEFETDNKLDLENPKIWRFQQVLTTTIFSNSRSIKRC